MKQLSFRLFPRWLTLNLFIVSIILGVSANSLSSSWRRHRHKRGRKIPLSSNENSISKQAAWRAWQQSQRTKRQEGGYYPGNEDSGSDYGPWTDWAAVTPCSRTCGGGVFEENRACQSEGACRGAGKRYSSCNVEECPPGSEDFRAEQCARYNSVPFEGQYYSWIPYTKGPRPCELNCLPVGERFYYRHDSKVVDGTRCDAESRDVCVDGKCVSVGCDLIIGSGTKEDKCRVCGGDGSTCTTVKGVMDVPNLTVGYNDVVLIPSGATNILIEEVKSSNNYLALRNETGFYYLNGNWKIDFPNAMKFCGTTFYYERKPEGISIFAPEIIRALGPTNESLYLVFLYQEQNPGVRYEFSISKDVAQTEDITYEWMFGRWGECSVTCGGGHATRNVTCVRASDFEPVDDLLELCDPRLKPASNMSCNEEPCQASWQIGNWTKCTSECGTLGWKFRHVFCGQGVSEGRMGIINDEHCVGILGEKPEIVNECNVDGDCPTWHVGDWSHCDKLCGKGKQSRKVLCHRVTNDTTELLDDDECSDDRPESMRDCDADPCEGVDWITSEWSECKGSCASSLKTRKLLCVTKDGKVVPQIRCDSFRKPESEKACEEAEQSADCGKRWYASEWSECSSECGEGQRTRHVFCGDYSDSQLTIASDDDCNADTKFSDKEACYGDADCKKEWFTAPFGKCSKKCGGGEKKRLVFCFQNETSRKYTDCDRNEKPFEKDKCNTDACTDDEVLGDKDMADDDDDLDWCDEDEEPTQIEDAGKIIVETTKLEKEMESTKAIKTTTPLMDVLGTTTPSVFDDDVTDDTESDAVLTTLLMTDDEDLLSRIGDMLQKGGKPLGDDTTGRLRRDVIDEALSDPDHYTESGSGEATTEVFSESFETDTTEGSAYGSTLDFTDYTESTTEDFTESETEDFTESETKDSTENATEDFTESETEDSTESETEDSTESVTEDSIASTTEDFVESTTEDSTDSVTEGSSDWFTEDSTEDMMEGSTPDISTHSPTTDMFDTEGSGEVTDTTEEPEEGSGMVPEVTTSETAFDETTTEMPSTSTESVTEMRKCKPRPKTDCSEEKFGCCNDGKTPATGPFDEGCDVAKTCNDTEFGCCPDFVSPAQGPTYLGCPGFAICANSLFGCCSDNFTEATGPDEEGCDNLITFGCEESKFGCCPNSSNAAEGEDFEGCDVYLCEGSAGCATCNETTFGCCPDGNTTALGDNMEGCPPTTDSPEEDPTESPDALETTMAPDEVSCLTSPFGCCPDNYTAAHGDNFEGCCLASPFGCCPDHITKARGPNMEGCGCEYSAFGCCPDNATVARGANNEGCGCEFTEFGCCPDNHFPAIGEKYAGCPCNTYEFGCCEDGVSISKGPNFEGCGCAYTEFGCCLDNRTPAKGPDEEGCSCEASQYGCCPDGETPAGGKLFEGCEDEAPIIPGEVCAKEKERGPCRNFTPKWYFDIALGQCNRFWYGGCEGNLNRFLTEDECKATCILPEGLDACRLPAVPGPCTGSQPAWYHDIDSATCLPFEYKGCLGNNNRFESKDQCEKACVVPVKTDVCLLELEPGPCRGNYSRWHYDKTSDQCKPFTFGGCKGNNNNFLSENECTQRCIRGRSKDICTLPKASGLCEDTLPRWYFDYIENRCMPFYYTGCDGNANRFTSRGECEATCAQEDAEGQSDACRLDKERGNCTDYEHRYYFDSSVRRCQQFVYGGCGGNENNYLTMDECQRSCEDRGTSEDRETFSTDTCFLPRDQGPCNVFHAQWHYDSTDGACKSFLYGGCEGNQNRFKSRHECEKLCGESQDICQLPLTIGRCSGSFSQWYYDSQREQCLQFDYSGCEGNKNRFDSLYLCQQRCDKDGITTTTTTTPASSQVEQVQDLPAICYLPQDTGRCRGRFPKWYYDSSENRCVGFTYGGCDGNANQFESAELCERQCGEYRNKDNCNAPVERGHCEDNIQKWYHDPLGSTCKSFSYSGCGGNGNRFSSQSECELECVHHDTILPDTSYMEICELEVDSGPCSDGFKRWYFNKETGECSPFVYGGCGGNQNRFKIFNKCTHYCYEAILKYSYNTTPSPAQSTTAHDHCEVERLNCGLLQCPYGITRNVDENNCDHCSCYDPCENMICFQGSECSVEHVRNDEADVAFDAVCREVSKPGTCPAVSGEISVCEQECESDAGCDSYQKCCFNGCAYVCMNPVSEVPEIEEPAYVPDPDIGKPPRITYHDEVAEVEQNDVANLRCQAAGTPSPSIAWYKDEHMIETDDGRFQQMLDYSLRIFNVEESDSGTYKCVARNGVLPDAEAFVQLQVLIRLRALIRTNTTEFPPFSEIRLPCDIQGYPPPTVYWYHDAKNIEQSNRILVEADYTLIIKNADESDAGVYKCEVRNQYGEASSTTKITIQGVYVHPTCTDNPFFANCKLIVRAKYCTNTYYARFCCRSCTLAGQLPSVGPHLQSDDSSSYKK